MSIEKISQEDYFNMLNEYGLNEDDVNRMINSKEFDKIAGEVINEPSELYYKAPSKIDKQGVFAKIKIFKNDFIGYGLKDKKRSLLGRYTNHSYLNNSKFIPEDKSDIILIATKDIEINEEILVNYRHHTKLPDGHKRNKGTNN